MNKVFKTLRTPLLFLVLVFLALLLSGLDNRVQEFSQVSFRVLPAVWRSIGLHVLFATLLVGTVWIAARVWKQNSTSAFLMLLGGISLIVLPVVFTYYAGDGFGPLPDWLDFLHHFYLISCGSMSAVGLLSLLPAKSALA